MSSVNAQTILDRLSKALKVNSDVELAAALDVAPQTISTWKKRNKVPYDHIVDISEKRSFSLDAIIFGQDWKNNEANSVKLAHIAKGMADILLAEDVLTLLNDELFLEEQGLNHETLSTVISAMTDVKKRLPGGLYLPGEHSSELKRGINNYIDSYREIMHIAKRNTFKKGSNKES
ncbi:helix-turn-helix domain-containing protein [Vibrio crassostreae]|uniref:helix-turn-helix domain-containing protein n=1 Tax=Vibrio crassostreae TaxID=246167 RepID=UPI002E19F475|nr:helix-turn-helix domain-containing protein [Vibrio crassostreae]